METLKNAKYTFRCNEDIREKFKMLCKIGNVSPSDILQDVMIEFCDNAEKIMKMEDITELRNLFNEKMNIVENELRDFNK